MKIKMLGVDWQIHAKTVGFANPTGAVLEKISGY